MKHSSRVFILTEIILGIMVITMTFIMIRGESGESIGRVSVIVRNVEDNRFSAFRYGLKMAAQDQDVEISVVNTGDLNEKEEKETIEQEIDNGSDAVIVQPVSEDSTKNMLKKIEKKIPVMQVNCKMGKSSKASELPFTNSDNYKMGETLAKELLRDYNGKIEGKTIGIVSETKDFGAVADRKAGFEKVLAQKGAEVLWSVSDIYAKEDEDILRSQLTTDIIVAFDDSSLTLAGECTLANNLHGALVYGIGNSTEAAYYLDVGAVQCLIVPDEFNMGYKSLTEIAKKLKSHSYKLKSQTVSYTVIRRDELFSEKNQKILFTMSQ